MKLVLYPNSISPHQLPLMRELAKLLGADNVLYAYESAESKGRRSLGWSQEPESWCRKASECMAEVENSDVLLVGGLRPIGLMERRAAIGRRTFYMSERWFKPPLGMLRLMHPKYFSMARRIVRLIRSVDSFIYLPIGVHAARDMARLCGLFAGDLRCLFRAPRLEFARKSGGRVFSRIDGEMGFGRVERVETCRRRDEGGRVEKRYCLDKMRMWGYFVEEGRGKREEGRDKNQLRVLWVGRMLGWKRVDTIIRAVGEISTRSTRLEPSCDPLHVSTRSTRLNITLDIYGTGPEEARLRKLASQYGDIIKFYPPVPIEQVRKLMREHDVYVLASNAYEGWGAVVSEALEEGMTVIGTYEAGSSATMLNGDSLFHADDRRTLAAMLAGLAQNAEKEIVLSRAWSARLAAQWLSGQVEPR